MKQWKILAALLFSAPIAGATTRTATTCNASDVQAKINASSDGDIVQIPAGICTWSTAVTVKRGITIQPVPATSPTITMNEVSGACGTLAVRADTSASFFLTGLTIFGGGIPGVCDAAVTIGTTASTKTFRIFGNTFDDNSPTSPVVVIKQTGIGPGLIDSNTMNAHTGADEFIQNWGSATPLDGSTWTTDVVPGSLNALYIESNTYNHIYNLTSNSAVVSAVSNYYGARYVFRYNTLNLGFYIDAHMGNSTTGTGARWGEIYQNTFVLPGTQPGQPFHQGSYWNIRGGSGLFYNNHSSGTPFQNVPPGWSFGQLRGSSDQQSGAWPLKWQIGRGVRQNHSPPYAWGNDFLTTGGGSSFPSYVQVGPTTNSSTCIANGTTRGHPANFCDGVNVGAGAQPTLTRCQSAADVTAGCPVTYTYTPAPFPHPLRAATSTSLSMTPSAPFNFGTVNTAQNHFNIYTIYDVGALLEIVGFRRSKTSLTETLLRSEAA